MSEERCELTELLVSQCGHCRRPSQRLRSQGAASHPVVEFDAAFRGACAAECGNGILPGQWIVRLYDGESITYAHRTCWEA